MTTEGLWYRAFHNGKPPTQRRLCRMPMDVQWQAAIEIAIAYASGRAGFRNVGKSYIGEITWYVTGWMPEKRSANSAESIWWLIPARVDRRIFAIYSAAVQSVSVADNGVATPQRVVSCLRKWRRTGAWRSIAAEIRPKRK